MSENIYTPLNCSEFYSCLNPRNLNQGDIIDAKGVGLKDPCDDDSYPDYYMIITKTCDLSFDGSHSVVTRSSIVNLLPCFGMEGLKKLLGRNMDAQYGASTKNVCLVSILSIFKAFQGTTVKKIDALMKDQISKFMFLPPDGNILKEPMVIDFELFSRIDGSDEMAVTQLLSAKKLQLNSPFREKIAQRFALHYMSIAIDDSSIKDKGYIKRIKEALKK